MPDISYTRETAQAFTDFWTAQYDLAYVSTIDSDLPNERQDWSVDELRSINYNASNTRYLGMEEDLGNIYSTQKAAQAYVDLRSAIFNSLLFGAVYQIDSLISGRDAYFGDRRNYVSPRPALSSSESVFNLIYGYLNEALKTINRYREFFNTPPSYNNKSGYRNIIVTINSPNARGVYTFGQNSTWSNALARWLARFENLYKLLDKIKPASAIAAVPPRAATPTTPTPTLDQAKLTALEQKLLKALPRKPYVKAQQAEPKRWGIKFTHRLSDGAYYDWYMALPPAMESTIPLQGARNVPGAGPGGLIVRAKPLIARHTIPGFGPIIQHLGISSTVLAFVGAFVGYEGYAAKDVDGFYMGQASSGAAGLNTAGAFLAPGSKSVDSYAAFVKFWEIVVQNGSQVGVEINVVTPNNDGVTYSKPTASSLPDEDSVLRSSNGNPRFYGYVNKLEAMYARRDRTWYSIEIEVHRQGRKEPIKIDCTPGEGTPKPEKGIGSRETKDGSLGRYILDCDAVSVEPAGLLPAGLPRADFPYVLGQWNVWLVNGGSYIWLESRKDGTILKGNLIDRYIADKTGVDGVDKFVGYGTWQVLNGKLRPVIKVARGEKLSFFRSNNKPYVKKVDAQGADLDDTYGVPVSATLVTYPNKVNYYYYDSASKESGSYTPNELEGNRAFCQRAKEAREKAATNSAVPSQPPGNNQVQSTPTPTSSPAAKQTAKRTPPPIQVPLETFALEELNLPDAPFTNFPYSSRTHKLFIIRGLSGKGTALRVTNLRGQNVRPVLSRSEVSALLGSTGTDADGLDGPGIFDGRLVLVLGQVDFNSVAGDKIEIRGDIATVTRSTLPAGSGRVVTAPVNSIFILKGGGYYPLNADGDVTYNASRPYEAIDESVTYQRVDADIKQ